MKNEQINPMKSRLLTFCTILATACGASAQKSKSPELAVLDRFVGTWDISGTYHLSGGEKVPFNSVSYRQWTQQGKTIHFDDPGSNPDDPGIQILLTYDPENQNYPGVTLMGTKSGQISGNLERGKANDVVHRNSSRWRGNL